MATAREKAVVAKAMAEYAAGNGRLAALKRRLYELAKARGETHWLESYYFAADGPEEEHREITG